MITADGLRTSQLLDLSIHSEANVQIERAMEFGVYFMVYFSNLKKGYCVEFEGLTMQVGAFRQ